jgi:NDP-4-keto-2,6-dideoxyhexose 3-C-methyltransferase
MSKLPIKLKRCRLCGSEKLVKVLDLGVQELTGVFPRSANQVVAKGPLELVKCHDPKNEQSCGLLQLGHSFDAGDMYGENYGYRSGLNASMVNHLEKKVEKIIQLYQPDLGDIVIDIGSNDGTTLGFYPNGKFQLLGIDPTGEKFKKFYPAGVDLIENFFSESLVKNYLNGRKAKVITSFSMFYDLDSPLKFAQEVRALLADDGVWVFEQSYMPTMLMKNSYDTVCHEHLEYYSLTQIKWIADRADLKIVDVEFNDVNGGSFSVTAAPATSKYSIYGDLDLFLRKELEMSLDQLTPYYEFAERVVAVKDDLVAFVAESKENGKKIAALGASTKGNVILQYCGFTQSDILFIAEVNPDKYESLTPGSHIPIVSEDYAFSQSVDFFIVLPWHFRQFFAESAKFKNKNLLFPLPHIEFL